MYENLVDEEFGGFKSVSIRYSMHENLSRIIVLPFVIKRVESEVTLTITFRT